MKKTFILLSLTVLAFTLGSCSKNDDPTPPGETQEAYIDATSSTTWNYYSFAEGKIIGSADESEENNAAWGIRKDWDIAIRRYHVRTNSGEFTKVNSQGGVYMYLCAKADGDIYVFDEKIPFSSVMNVPLNIEFKTDKSITHAGMGGDITLVRSEVETMKMKKKWDDTNKQWVTEMPPVYLKAPLCIFRSADGNHYYKVEFTQYMNDEGKTGHVKFNVAKITKE